MPASQPASNAQRLSQRVYGISTATVRHFEAPTAKVPILGQTGYIAVTALVLNLAVALVLSVVLRFVPASAGVDFTAPDNYLADRGDERLIEVPTLTGRAEERPTV